MGVSDCSIHNNFSADNNPLCVSFIMIHFIFLVIAAYCRFMQLLYALYECSTLFLTQLTQPFELPSTSSLISVKEP